MTTNELKNLLSEITEIVNDNPGDWAPAVDCAIETAGLTLAECPDRDDGNLIATLDSGAEIRWSEGDSEAVLWYEGYAVCSWTEDRDDLLGVTEAPLTQDEIATLREIKRTKRAANHLWLDDSGWPRRLALFEDDACAAGGETGDIGSWDDEGGHLADAVEAAGLIDSRASDPADPDTLTGEGRC